MDINGYIIMDLSINWCIYIYRDLLTTINQYLVGGIPMSSSVGKCLVVLTCFNHLEKYEFVNGKDYPIDYGKKMSQTINQMNH